MVHQKISYWCGLASAANALECLGIVVDQEHLATLCHVTKRHGTSETELMRALLAYKVKVDPWDSRRRRRSTQWLQAHLWDRGPAILCVDSQQHWIVAIGILNQTSIWVFDPATGCGLERIEIGELADRWRLPNRFKGPNYYGVGVSK
jgi:ABC-type bacteriocin/lantibiotic exporter with double-glycine peptidase domain